MKSTVGIVVVSHSRALARAALALAAEMVPDRPVRIEVAAGLDETTLGTDATAIADAIVAADSGDGVVVLMDLGSAVLSAELALELLDDARDRVVLCPAPLLEGLVAAAVAAAGGAAREEVAVEAAAGLSGKQAQLGTLADRTGLAGSPGSESTATFTIATPHGLHARPAARLVTLVRAYDADVRIRNLSTGSPWVPASSLSRVATLGALRAHELEVSATGPQAREAVDQVVGLAARAFDEPIAPAPEPLIMGSGPPKAINRPPNPMINGSQGTVVWGRPASPGVGIGPAWRPRAAPVVLPDVPSLGSDAERRRITAAVDAVRGDLRQIRSRTGDTGPATIFDAHLLLLDDADLLGDVRSRIENGRPAPQAWSAATGRIAAEFDALPDPYLKARAADVRAVGEQVLRALLGVPPATTRGSGVLVAADLTPAEAARLDPAQVSGVLLAYGSPTAHAAILARTRGFPAVVAAGPGVLDIPDGTPIALDGGTGEVAVDPPEPILAAYRARAAEQAELRARAAARSSAPAVTRDGVPIAVGANVGSLADARTAADNGADLAGLVRTEFLFLGRTSAPGVDEQEAAYREIADALGGRRITLRTLDVGGDKPLGYLPSAAEENPFLGVRGIRHSLRHPELFADQLRAIVRIAHDVPVSLMFPMIGTIDEVRAARRALDEAIGPAGRPAGLRVGIMVEVPATAVKAAAFVPYVDFFSIGTNDLAQYALAAERGNAALAELGDGLDPGVLRLIDVVCRAARDRVEVAVCGELAADERALPLLAGLGVRQLSVAPRAVPAVKEAVRATSLDQAAELAAQALDLPDAAAVRALRP